ncbi:MAG: DUF4178 domain-containing protein [Rhodobacteraceae bacterium]|nr:DUF4178 domain-containing protein [Paracoccaceae bacterium]
MTLAQLAAVSCPNCGAGLQVLGGGRVVTHVCRHCGTQLDAIENYRKLRTFANMRRPETPFSIGLTGRILNVDWTIIGILGQTERSGGETWTWVDHQLYSPTHGYAWLTLEDDHLTLTRRYRGALRPGWLSTLAVEFAENPPVVTAEGTTYKYYETAASEATFAEGEFTWAVGVGDKTTTITLMSNDAMISLSETGAEREVERAVYLPQAETCAAFGVAALNPYHMHPLKPLLAGPNAGFVQTLGLACAAICLILSLIFTGMTGTTALPSRHIARSALPAELSFEITDTRGLTTLYLQADVNNSWAWVEATLSDPQGAPVFTAGREVDFYNGTDSDGYWTEGSPSTQISFHPEMPGEYTLELDVPEGGLNEDMSGPRLSTLTVSILNGGAAPFWTLLAAVVFAGIGGFHFARSYLHNRARWAGSDWSDED